MKFARMKYKYKYEMSRHPHDWDRWPRDGNIGDCIQNLAVENLYREYGLELDELILINRDEIPQYKGEKCILPMQAWFGNYAGTFPLPWSDDIEPVFIGFHLNKGWETRERFIRENIHEQMKPFQPIGCRDRNTKDFLLSLGLDAYFSGCMTLTFPNRKETPKDGKVFIVDLTQSAQQAIPKDIDEIADKSITHFYYFNQYPVTDEGAQEFEDTARNILNRYKTEARLVITSKIHCAMPCIAMGIPAIFINEDLENERFDVLKGLIPMYTPEEISKIDWNPEAPDIDEFKKVLKENALLRISKSAENNNMKAYKSYEESQVKDIEVHLKKLSEENIAKFDEHKSSYKKKKISLTKLFKLRLK